MAFTSPKHLLYLSPLLLALSACGSGSNKSPDSTPETKGAIINGAAIKGIIKNGRVEVYGVSQGQITDQPIITGTTSAAGSYSITLPATYSGPVQVVVKGKADGTSTMTCDALDGCTNGGASYTFGADMPLGNISLEALLPNAEKGKTITGSVTPLTHMAAAYAKSLGLHAQGIGAANLKIANQFGLRNITGTIPPDITNSSAATSSDANELQYAAISAAVASIAQDDFNGDFSAALANISQGYADNQGQFINNESMDNPNVVSLQELTGTARSMIDDLEDRSEYAGMNTGAKTALMQLETDAENATPDALTNTQVTVTVSGDMQKVKNFVQDVRTWGNVIESDVQSKADAFDTQLTMASEALDDSAGSLIEAFAVAVVAANRAYEDNFSSNALSAYSSDFEGLTIHSGTIAETNGTINVTGSVTPGGATEAVAVDVDVTIPDKTGTIFNAKITVNDISNTSSTLAGSLGDVTLTFASSVNTETDFEGENYDNNPKPDSLDIKLKAVLAQKTTASITDPVTFSGEIEIDIVAVKDRNNKIITHNPASIMLKGNFANTTGDSFDAVLSGAISNADVFDNTAYDESVTNFAKFNLSLGFTGQLDGLPEASYLLTGNRTAFKKANVSLAIAYGTRRIDISAAAIGENRGTAEFKITNQQGVALIASSALSDEQMSAVLTLDGIVYGTVRYVHDAPVITYSDGTFETL
ncbi:MAG TPA: hypothetical protein ENJ07_03030 [Gammaproteobacteria bacterium]|nr:hypothetical protein [Gammaproteobacteria bacterium]